jgi:membrane associated rhomboid family serine protease
MGVYDRDYARAQGGVGSGSYGGGLGQRRPWIRTVNAWLIILCVGVFVIDGFMGGGGTNKATGAIETGSYWVPEHRESESGPWVQITGTPFYGASIRSEQTTLGTKIAPYRVSLREADGTIGEARVQGLPIYAKGRDGQPRMVGLAEATPASGLMKAMHFSTKRVVGGAELWRLVSFQFLHADLFHLMFNMLALYFFGVLIENVLGGKRYLAFYLSCGIAGGLLYLMLNLAGYLWVEQAGLPAIPGLLFNATGTPLIGASAGVFGVLIGGAFLAPQARVLVFFVIPMKLATLAWVLIGVSVVTIIFGWDNAGGEAAHLGGAAAGWALMRHPGRLHRFFDWLGRFDPTSRRFRSGAGKQGGSPHGVRADEIDRILAKISSKGLQSLTNAEKRKLQAASEGDDR